MSVSVLYVRQFVPQELDVSDFQQLQPLYQDLLDRSLASPDDLKRWLIDYSELDSIVDEHGARRYIDKSCHTDDPEIAKAYLHFVEQIEPKVKPLAFALRKKFLECPHRASLAEPQYRTLAKHWQAEVDLYRDENVALEVEATKLVSQYDETCGAMEVEFRGETFTPQQMARFIEEPDRVTRREAWEAVTRRRLQDREKIDALYDQLLPLRTRIATNAGLGNYRDWVWKAYKRFDYTPDQCRQFADAIEEVCVPIVRGLDDERVQKLSLDTLRPWDRSCDVLGRPPLRPFDPGDIDGFVEKTHSIFCRINPALAEDFDILRRRGNLDLDSRRGKQPGGYQSTLNECREPFIFMNAAGLHRDVETLLHEGGHAFHALAARDEPLVFLRSAPMEFCEVASMAMELFANDHLDVFYADGERARAVRSHLEGIVRFLPFMATIDQFQHWVWLNPAHTRDQRTSAWLALLERFASRIDWTGWEDARDSAWQEKLHLFHAPFYYIEYGIAQLGALQLWMKSRTDPLAALNGYRAALKLGGTRSLPELFAAAGIQFDFSLRTLRPLMHAVQEELASLPA
jgi:oligoendopeptidase F